VYFGNIENMVWNFFNPKKNPEKKIFFKWYLGDMTTNYRTLRI